MPSTSFMPTFHSISQYWASIVNECPLITLNQQRLWLIYLYYHTQISGTVSSMLYSSYSYMITKTPTKVSTIQFLKINWNPLTEFSTYHLTNYPLVRNPSIPIDWTLFPTREHQILVKLWNQFVNSKTPIPYEAYSIACRDHHHHFAQWTPYTWPL